MKLHERTLLALALLLAAPGSRAGEPVPTALGPALDLTHPFDAETIYWPTEEGFVLERGSEGRTERWLLVRGPSHATR